MVRTAPCGGISVLDPEWEQELDQRIAAVQRTGKTRLSSERRILLLHQLMDELVGPLEEFRLPRGSVAVPRALDHEGAQHRVRIGTAVEQQRAAQTRAAGGAHSAGGTPAVRVAAYFASVVIAAGASLSEAADYLGNSEAEVRRTYAHFVPERADEIRRAAGGIIHAQERHP